MEIPGCEVGSQYGFVLPRSHGRPDRLSWFRFTSENCMCLRQGAWSQVWSRVGGHAQFMSVPHEANGACSVYAKTKVGGGQDLLCMTQRHGNAWFVVYMGQGEPPGS